MYYTTVCVQKWLGNEHEVIDNDLIDKAIEAGLGMLGREANGPVILTNVIPIVISVPPYPRVFLTIMAKPYEPPVRLTEVRGAQIDDALIRTKSRFL